MAFHSHNLHSLIPKYLLTYTPPHTPTFRHTYQLQNIELGR